MSAPETAILKAASTATYSGSAGAVYFGLTANELAAFGGLGIAVIGLLVSWYYKHQHLQIAKKNNQPADDE